MGFLKSNLLLAAIFAINITFTYAQCNINFNTIPTIGEGCDVLGVQFNSTVTGTTLGTPVWDFGDGSVKFNGKNPFHNYTTKINDTIYTVTLSVTCIDGSTAVQKGSVAVFAKPKAGFEFPSQELCTFSDILEPINTSSKGSSLSYKWEFGDNETATGPAPKHVYSLPGTYDVVLEVTNEKGCRDKVQKSIVAKPAPNAEFSMDQFIGCQPVAVSVTNITQNDASLQTTNFEWSASNGSKVNDISPTTFVFANHGIQEITLTVTNSLGCSNTTSANVLVKQAPQIVGTTIPVEVICYDTPLSISIQTDPATTNIVWKPTSGVSVDDSLSKSPNISFENGGMQRLDAKLSFNGCTRDTFFLFNVVQKPILSMDYEPKVICEEEQVTLTASPSGLASYVFTNNNNLIPSNAHLAGINKLAINNQITLQAIDNAGCKLSTSTTIVAKDKPSISLVSNAVRDTVCINQPINLLATPAGLDQYRFTINGNELQSGLFNTYTIPSANQPVDVRLIAEKNGCFDTTVLKTIRLKLPSGVPNINCVESGFDFINFGFDNIKGDNAYEISINQGVFSPIAASGNYVLKQLTANTEYSAQVRVKLAHQSPCDSLVFSDIVTCKTIPCEKLDFKLTPLVEKFCESGSATFNIDSVISPSGTYNIYWNDTKSTSTNYNLSNLNADKAPYTVTVGIEDPSRSPGCKLVQKKAMVYVDKQPDTTGFLYVYDVDDFCKPEPYLQLSVINPNPTYHYTFTSDQNASSSGTTRVRLPYESPASQVILEIESPNQACKAQVVKAVVPHDMADVKVLNIDSLLFTKFDSTTCEAPWSYHLHTAFDTVVLKELKRHLPGFTSLTITRMTKYKEGMPSLSFVGSFDAADVPNTFVFSKGLDAGDEYVFSDSVAFLNEHNCPIAASWSIPDTIERPNDCGQVVFLYCENRKDTITIQDMEVFQPCLDAIKSKINYFSEKPVGYTLVDSFTVVRNLDTSSTVLHIKNRKYGCFNAEAQVCSFYCDTSLYIPNAITPNGDQKNDKWEIKFAHGTVVLKVYNRWEQLVFSSDNYQNTFEGVSNEGVLLPDGVYFYEIKIDGASHLKDQEFGRNAKTMEEVVHRAYEIASYDCEPQTYKMLKGKLLIQR